MEASGRQSDQIFDIILQFLEFLNDDHKEKVLFFRAPRKHPMATRSIKLVVVGDRSVGGLHKEKRIRIFHCGCSFPIDVSCVLDFQRHFDRKDVFTDLLHSERVSTKLHSRVL